MSRLIPHALVGLSLVCQCAEAAPYYPCPQFGYVKKIAQGWPLDDNYIGIMIEDANGAEFYFKSEDTTGSRQVRALLSIALTAFATQTPVGVSLTRQNGNGCTTTTRLEDGKNWVPGLRGIYMRPSY